MAQRISVFDRLGPKPLSRNRNIDCACQRCYDLTEFPGVLSPTTALLVRTPDAVKAHMAFLVVGENVVEMLRNSVPSIWVDKDVADTPEGALHVFHNHLRHGCPETCETAQTVLLENGLCVEEAYVVPEDSPYTRADFQDYIVITV